MADGCMDKLKGKWEFSREPFREGKLQDLHLTSDASGNVAGSATLTIDGQVFNLEVSGKYNVGGIEISVSTLDEQLGFGFDGNCVGPNVFKGPMYTEITVEAQLKYLGG